MGLLLLLLQATRSLQQARVQHGAAPRRIALAKTAQRVSMGGCDGLCAILVHQGFLPYTQLLSLAQTRAAAVEAPATADWAALAKELDTKSPLEIMDNVS